MKRLEAPLATIRPFEPDDEAEGDVALVANANSLDFLRAIYFDPAQPVSRRMRAAIAALPFEQPKLAVVASMTASDSFAAKLEAAIVRSGKMIEGDWTGSTAGEPNDIFQKVEVSKETN